jgi:DUF4097 and DUF4098 domain-containing protein YvlB
MESFKKTWWRLAPICLVIVGCGPFKLSNRYSAVETVLKSYKVEGKQQIVAETFNGAVDVLTGAADKVEIKVTKRTGGPNQDEADDDLDNIDVRLEQTGNKVVIHVRSINPKPFVNRGAAIEIQVPEGSTLDLRTTNGKVSTVGLVGDTVAHSSNGPIQAQGSRGTLDLETSNGSISVNGGVGKISAKSSNGGIDIVSDNALLAAHTSNGRISYRGKLGAGDHVLSTSNGSVTVKLPADAAFGLKAKTSNGKITTDFTNESEAPSKKKKPSKSQLSGTFGARQSSALLDIQTSNGSIEIRHQ